LKDAQALPPVGGWQWLATVRPGGPPYYVSELTPTKAFGLPVDGETTNPTHRTF
jgi:hypothetical protein